jgi:tetratricopeptide (TPR) repeat protein
LPPAGYANELDPNLSEAFYNRGTLKHRELGDPTGALADYDRAIALDPNLAAAYFVRSLLKHDLLNDVFGAVNDYNLAIALDPQIVEGG